MRAGPSTVAFLVLGAIKLLSVLEIQIRFAGRIKSSVNIKPSTSRAVSRSNPLNAGINSGNNMNTRQAYAIRAMLCLYLRKQDYSFEDISAVLKLGSKEKARALVARGYTNEKNAWNTAMNATYASNPLSREVKPVKTPCRGKGERKKGGFKDGQG